MGVYYGPSVQKPITITLEAAEVWFYRQIMGISCVEYLTNEQLLQRVEQTQPLVRIIEHRNMHSVKEKPPLTTSTSGPHRKLGNTQETASSGQRVVR